MQPCRYLSLTAFSIAFSVCRLTTFFGPICATILLQKPGNHFVVLALRVLC